MNYAGATSFQELQQLDSVTLMTANAKQIFNSQPIGTFTYGPVVDGDFVPDLPGILFANGSFDQSVEILAGHNAREGPLFTSPELRNDSAIINLLSIIFGPGQQKAYEFIVYNLYPAIYDGTQPYNNWYERASLITSEFAFICNNYYMFSAAGSHSYGYVFDMFPGFHGQDAPYTFFAGFVNATNIRSVQNADAALTLQDWIVSFVMGKSPSTTVFGSPDLPLYDAGRQVGFLSNENVLAAFEASLTVDPVENERCLWWQQGVFAPAA